VTNKKQIIELTDLLHRLMMGGAVLQEDLDQLSELSKFDIKEIVRHDELTAMTVDCLSYMLRQLIISWPEDNYNEAKLRAIYRIALGINEEIVSVRIRT